MSTKKRKLKDRKITKVESTHHKQHPSLLEPTHTGIIATGALSALAIFWWGYYYSQNPLTLSNSITNIILTALWVVISGLTGQILANSSRGNRMTRATYWNLIMLFCLALITLLYGYLKLYN